MSNTEIHSKLPDVGTTIFTVMSKMALDHGAINLSQGFPDFEVAPALQHLVAGYMKQGFNQYAPMPGLPRLLHIIGKKISHAYGTDIQPDQEITITSGATEALYAAISAMVNPGDEVIVLEPAYDSYVPAIQLNGGVPVFVPLEAPQFKVDWQRVADKISTRTKLIIINTPHNPTGTIMNDSDMIQLSKLVEAYGLWVISDEVYEHLIYDNKPHESILKYPILRERGVAIYSFGKTFHATGWKTGYAVARPDLSTEIRKVHQYLTFSVNTPIQYALADFLEDEQNYNGLNHFFQQKRDYFLQLISKSKFQPIKSSGTYFQLLSYKNVGINPDVEMATWLTQQKGIASIPISVFYHDKTDNHLLRFCFAKNENTLAKGAEILCRI